MADSAPLLSAEEGTARLHGHGAVFVIALPDHHHDDVAAPAERQERRRPGWRLAGALLVLAAFAVAGHYCYGLHSSPEVLREQWRKWSDDRGGASFLLPLHPKKAGGTVKASPERACSSDIGTITTLSKEIDSQEVKTDILRPALGNLSSLPTPPHPTDHAGHSGLGSLPRQEGHHQRPKLRGFEESPA